MRIGHDEGRTALLDGLDAFGGCVRGLSDLDLMAASRCTGWTAGDVIVHVHLGLQEMLLGLVSRTGEPADTDASGYWLAPPPSTGDEVDGIRFVRLLGAAYQRPTRAVRHLQPTLAGVRAATERLEPCTMPFQGRVLDSGDFLATWAVEVAVHHLDLGRELTVPPPAASALRLARRTVEALAGEPAPAAWPDDTTVLLGTGRIRPDAGHTRDAPTLTAKLPVLG